MKKIDGILVFSPSDLTAFIESEFTSWMDRHHLENPGKFEMDEVDESDELVQDKGNVHEQEVLAQLITEYGKVHTVPAVGNFETRHIETIEAMKRGEPVIYQAALKEGRFAGYADFIIKVQGKSKLGDYHYEAWDSKLAHSTKPYFIIQLLGYSTMLAEIQGVFPASIAVVLGTKERRTYKTAEFAFYYAAVKTRFLDFQDGFDPKTQPIPKKGEEIRRWGDEAATLIVNTDHLSQVANIRSVQIRKLEDAGITTMKALAESTRDRVPKMEPTTFKKLQKQAQLQIASKGKDKPVFEILPHPENVKVGLQSIPPFSEGDIYFDMEGYPLFENEGLEYLFGLIVHQGKDTEFIDFWAHSRAQEKKAFEDFIDFVYQRFKQYPDLHIYHYAAYEVTAVRKLSTRHATREFEVDELLRANVFVDLYKVVTQSMMVGEPSYSIKYIEHLYLAKRTGDVTNAGASIVEYAKYLEKPDGPDWKTSKVLKGIRDYNEDDCVSTIELTKWLREQQAVNGLPYVTKKKEEDEDPAKALQQTQSEAEILANQMLAGLNGKEVLTEDERVKKLLAELLQFHRREKKQYYWKYFEWIKLTHIELIDETECIGAITRSGNPVAVKKSQECEYAFDPAQDVKFTPESSCKLFIDDDRIVPATISRLDSKNGMVAIKLGPKVLADLGGTFPDVASILPPDPISTATIEASILDTVKSETLRPALRDFLHRSKPRLKSKANTEQLKLEDVLELDDSCICIQGPPGAGKTHSGSDVILNLLERGKKVAITSNTHQAIENLLKGVLKRAKECQKTAKVFKVNSTTDEELEGSGIEQIKPDEIADLEVDDGKGYVVGATAWGLVRDEVKNQFDYLFIDEAGQVSLANLVAVSRCTNNLVLLGDQMQLEQPVQGSHPGESSESCLTYLIQNHATIPPDLGVFLSQTYRMRPEVCAFVSRSFYESRLTSADQTKTRSLKQKGDSRVLKKTEGILFVEEVKGDHTQANMDEVRTIAEIIEALKNCEFIDNGKSRTITEKDIMVVAPYNLQVNLLKANLPEGVKVGTVDKFQGGEAPVAILSMCASSLENAPRGIEFIFNPNRINVALSRAKCLAIVVGNPALQVTDASTLEKMKLVNLFCAMVRAGSG